MSVPNEEADTNIQGASDGESSGKHSIMTSLKSSVIWLVVILGILAVISWAATEFGFMPQTPAK